MIYIPPELFVTGTVVTVTRAEQSKKKYASQRAATSHWRDRVFSVEQQQLTWVAKLNATLAGFAQLQSGWDGDDADPPSALAISRAREFLLALHETDFKPDRVAPSVVSGIGFTFQRGDRLVYVEVYNNGSIYTMLADGDNDPDIFPVNDAADWPSLIEQGQTFLR